MKNAGVFNPEEINAAATMDLDNTTVAWNLAAHRSQKQLLDERKAASEEASSQGTLLRGQTMAAEFAAKMDPSSPQYNPSAAYIAKRAAAGDPEAKQILAGQTQQAGARAGAEAAAKYPYELALKREELAQNPVFAVNPKTGQRELTTAGDLKTQGFTNPVKVSQTDIEKETALNAQLNELQLNTSRYKAALQNMSDLSQQDVNHMVRILSDQDVHSALASGVGMDSLFSIIEKGSRAKDWNELSPDKQEALMGALRMRNSALLFQKVATGMGRASKDAIDIELQNMPDPYEGGTVGLKKLGVFQENVDQMPARSVKLPWMEGPADVKARIEQQAVADYNKRRQSAQSQGKYHSNVGPVRVGQQIPLGNGIRVVKKVYRDGTFDAE